MGGKPPHLWPYPIKVVCPVVDFWGWCLRVESTHIINPFYHKRACRWQASLHIGAFGVAAMAIVVEELEIAIGLREYRAK